MLNTTKYIVNQIKDLPVQKDIETIDELFRWRLSANECQALKVNPISELSVEKKNK